MPRVLLVDDDHDLAQAMRSVIEGQGCDVEVAATVAAAKASLSEGLPDYLFLDLMLPDGNGFDILGVVPDPRDTHVVFMTGHASVGSAVKAIRGRADDYLVKPFTAEQLRDCLARLSPVAEDRAATEDEGGAGPTRHFGCMVGESAAMRSVYDEIRRVGPSAATVLIQGESGTGKELVARALHNVSGRAGPFVAVNCGGIQPSLVASELFGHEKGSFTGASQRHQGMFERANGGTLFLDEITEMPQELQSHLLRVLETRRVTRLGGHSEIELDVRVIAATNRDPVEAIADGRLREDLYYRICDFPIMLPPLRERRDDIRPLALHFIQLLNGEHDTARRLDDAAIEFLAGRELKGNARELRHILHRALLTTDEDTISRDQVERSAARSALGNGNHGSDSAVAPGTPLADVERTLILQTLSMFDGDKKKTAEALGISLRTLYNRLRSYRHDED